MDVTDVAGIDVGLTLVERTSGVCRTGSSGDLVTHTYIDRLSRSTALGGNLRFSVLAIDAPVLPEGQLHYDGRSCEKVFVWGDFQKRCKCGESWVRGTGQALRRAGVDTAHAFADIVCSNEPTSPFPRVFDSRNIVDAFPNAFLGVSLPDGVFESTPLRGEKFDWLYDQWLEYKMPEVLQAALRWHREQYWGAVSENRHHDERAALVCALTGICVLQGCTWRLASLLAATSSCHPGTPGLSGPAARSTRVGATADFRNRSTFGSRANDMPRKTSYRKSHQLANMRLELVALNRREFIAACCRRSSGALR